MSNKDIQTVWNKHRNFLTVPWAGLREIQGVSKNLPECGAHKALFLDTFIWYAGCWHIYLLPSFLTHGSSEGRCVSHCYRLLWRTQHALLASCSSRLLLLLCSLVSTIYSIWMKLPSSDNVAQWVGHQCKMAERVERSVYFSFNRTCAFLKLWWRYLMNIVIYFIDRRSTHHYYLFVWIIINTKCNLMELGTGPSTYWFIYVKPQHNFYALHIRPGSITVQVKPLFW